MLESIALVAIIDGVDNPLAKGIPTLRIVEALHQLVAHIDVVAAVALPGIGDQVIVPAEELHVEQRVLIPVRKQMQGLHLDFLPEHRHRIKGQFVAIEVGTHQAAVHAQLHHRHSDLQSDPELDLEPGQNAPQMLANGEEIPTRRIPTKQIKSKILTSACHRLSATIGMCFIFVCYRLFKLVAALNI